MTERNEIAGQFPSHFSTLVLAKINGNVTKEHAVRAAHENPCGTIALLASYKSETWAIEGIRAALEDALAAHLWAEEFKKLN